MIVPLVILPAATCSAPSQTSMVIAPKISAITIAVINARMRMRFFAAVKVFSTASAKRCCSRFSCPKACTILSAPSDSDVMVPMSATRS